MLKEYIVELEMPFDTSLEYYFQSNGGNIIFHDSLLPELIIVETAKDICEFNYIRDYNESRTGELLHKKQVKAFKNIHFEPKIEDENLHNIGYGFGMKIAVLDSGVNNKICPDVKEGIDFTGMGTYTENAHGSIVTRIIKHFAKAATVYSVKVCHQDDPIIESNVFKALKWAKEQEVDVINMSIGFNCNCDGSCKLSKYINTIVENYGIIIVAAAGNDFGEEGKKVHCPACSTEVISVGALSENGMDVAKFSVAGRINSDKPNVLAPGHGHLQTIDYSSPFIGTSFASPVVAGILGCLVSYNPNMDITITADPLEFKKAKMQRIRMKLYETTSYLEGVFTSKQGLGKINLQKLLEVLENEDQSNTRGKAN